MVDLVFFTVTVIGNLFRGIQFLKNAW